MLRGELKFTFKQGMSAVEAVYILGEMIKSREKERGWLREGVLDVTKAYDRVVREVLWNQLKEAGCVCKVLALIQLLDENDEGNHKLGGIKGRARGWVGIENSNRGVMNHCIISNIVRRHWRGWW